MSYLPTSIWLYQSGKGFYSKKSMHAAALPNKDNWRNIVHNDTCLKQKSNIYSNKYFFNHTDMNWNKWLLKMKKKHIHSSKTVEYFGKAQLQMLYILWCSKDNLQSSLNLTVLSELWLIFEKALTSDAIKMWMINSHATNIILYRILSL